MPCSLPWVVGDVNVSGAHDVRAEVADGIAHSGRQCTDKGGDAARVLRKLAACRIRHDYGEVVGFRGKSGKRGAHEQFGRLVDDRSEAGRGGKECECMCEYWW